MPVPRWPRLGYRRRLLASTAASAGRSTGQPIGACSADRSGPSPSPESGRRRCGRARAPQPAPGSFVAGARPPIATGHARADGVGTTPTPGPRHGDAGPPSGPSLSGRRGRRPTAGDVGRPLTGRGVGVRARTSGPGRGRDAGTIPTPGRAARRAARRPRGPHGPVGSRRASGDASAQRQRPGAGADQLGRGGGVDRDTARSAPSTLRASTSGSLTADDEASAQVQPGREAQGRDAGPVPRCPARNAAAPA